MAKRKHGRIGAALRGALPGLALVAALLVASPLRAEPSAADRETARTLMDDGDRKVAARDYEGALNAYRAAHAIMGVPTTGLEVGKAEEALGHLVEARDAYLAVARTSPTSGEPGAFAKARAEAARRSERIASRIPSIVIQVSGVEKNAAISVKIDGQTIPAESLGLARKVNPGPHAIIVEAPGHLSSKRRVVLDERETHTVTIALEKDDGETTTKIPPKAKARDAHRAPVPKTERRSHAMVGVGIAATSLGVTFLGITVLAALDSVYAGGPLALGLSGVALVGTGIPLIVVGNQKVPMSPKASIAPVLAPGYAGLRGTF